MLYFFTNVYLSLRISYTFKRTFKTDLAFPEDNKSERERRRRISSQPRRMRGYEIERDNEESERRDSDLNPCDSDKKISKKKELNCEK
jgi:hypothetical protein